MGCKNKIVTSEYVSYGHPDKLADQIADQILYDISLVDKNVRAGIEVMVKDNIVVLGGEISTTADINYDTCVRKVFDDIGYPQNHHLTPSDIKVINLIGKQSPEISTMVDKENGTIGAGDQGFCVGYASNETPDYMPLGHYLAQKICLRVCHMTNRKFGQNRCVFGPDVKTQVIVSYDENENATVDYILVSSMHPEGHIEDLREAVRRSIWGNIGMFDDDTFEMYIKGKDIKIDVNPYGYWSIGGPISDCGVTGRKVVVDQFGGYCNVGGGAFSGKDLTKVDRSGAYMARYLAKNIIATGICDNAKVELSYVIGESEPCALNIELNRNCVIVPFIKDYIIKNIDLSPSGIINRFTENGRRNIMYTLLSRFGHYGDLRGRPWERLDFYDDLNGKINEYLLKEWGKVTRKKEENNE